MSSGLENEIKLLVELGRDVKLYYHIERCDHIPAKWSYLDELPEEEYDDEDRAAKIEYDQYMISVEAMHKKVKALGPLERVYQKFYTTGIRVISALAPERLNDFRFQYDTGRRSKLNYENYCIQDGLRGIRNASGAYGPSAALPRISNQLSIIEAIDESLGSTLFEIEETLRADLFDHELDAARHLLGRGHIRAAGAVAGVVLEEHLKRVSDRHGYAGRRKNPSISDFNEHLKSSGVLDVAQWRRIQLLGDTRNLCDHAKDKVPTNEDVEELISGVNRVIKSVF